MSSLRRRDPWEIATALLLACFAALALVTFRSYGVTWDEKHSALNGRYFLDWYASGFSDHAIISENNQRLYGSFFNAISAFVADHSPLGSYDTGHLVIAVTGLAGLFLAYRLGKLLGGSMAGFFSALILALTPIYYGHSFINPKDLPFAVLFLASLYCLLRVYDELPVLSWRSVLALGGVLGLALGVKVGALMLFGYFVVLAALRMLAIHRGNHSYGARGIATDLRAAVISLVKVGVVAWSVMLVWWPYAQVSPILNPLRAFKRNANFDWQGTVLYRGQFIPSKSLPWHYLPTWFLITLPEFYAIIFGIGLVALILRMALREPGREDVNAGQQSRLLFLAFAILFPLATAIAMRPILYDANRHFLFVIPPLAVAAGVTLAWILREARPRPLRILTAAIVLLVSGATIVDMVRLHPYQYLFFNRSSGGLRAALGRYETDYWGESHKEGMDWLAANYRPGAPPASIRVANTAADFQTAYYIHPDRPETLRFTPVKSTDNPDVVLSITRWDRHLKHPGKVLHVVQRMGTPLLYVVEVSPPAAAPLRE